MAKYYWPYFGLLPSFARLAPREIEVFKEHFVSSTRRRVAEIKTAIAVLNLARRQPSYRR